MSSNRWIGLRITSWACCPPTQPTVTSTSSLRLRIAIVISSMTVRITSLRLASVVLGAADKPGRIGRSGGNRRLLLCGQRWRGALAEAVPVLGQLLLGSEADFPSPFPALFPSPFPALGPPGGFPVRPASN